MQEREVTTVPMQPQQQQYQQQQSSALTVAAVFNGEMIQNSIYANPMFEYQEHSVPECEFHANTIMVYKTISSMIL